MLTVRGLTHSYGRSEVLHGLDFEVEKGEILGFLGPNGAGKSTTMKILVGYLRPDDGEVLFNGRDIRESPYAIRSRLGYLPENVPVYPELTVDEYLGWVARIKGALPARDKVARVRGLCGLDAVRTMLVSYLSRGYRQRLGLAQAVLGPVELLILDEPTVGLDPAQIREIRDLIRNLGREITIVLSTHILPEVELTCDRVLIINKGRIVAEDTPANLVSRVGGGGRYTLRLDIAEGDETDVAERLAALDFVKGAGTACWDRFGCAFIVETDPAEDRRADISRAVHDMGLDLLEFKPADVSLEEAFLSLVGAPGREEDA